MTDDGRTEQRDEYGVTKTRSPLRSAIDPLVMQITTQAKMVNIGLWEYSQYVHLWQREWATTIRTL
jgi:hypothetical protein